MADLWFVQEGGVHMEGMYALGKPLARRCVGRGYSFFFDLIRQHFSGTFEHCGAIHRICSYARKMGVTHVVREELPIERELKEEIEDLGLRHSPARVQGHFQRFSFYFAPRMQQADGDTLFEALIDEPDMLFLGYAVAATIEVRGSPIQRSSYILESVMRASARCCLDEFGTPRFRPLTNHYLHCHRPFKITIGDNRVNRDFDVDGAFFCQQNGRTHVCAHACLRMALNTYADSGASKITNKMINDVLSIDHRGEGKRFGLGEGERRGLDDREMLSVFEWAAKIRSSAWTQPYVADFALEPGTDYAQCVYPYVESGIPVILSFQTESSPHVVTIVGHTLNSDRWDCEAQACYFPRKFRGIYPSATWVDHFIVNDDYFGMYSAMPLDYLRHPFQAPSAENPSPPPRVKMVLCGQPHGANVSAYLAEQTAVGRIRNLAIAGVESLRPWQDSQWLDVLLDYLRDELREKRGLVVRTVLGEKEGYLAHLARPSACDSYGKSFPGLVVRRLREHLPRTFWITEFSLPDLYTANKRKLGDFLHASSCGQEGTSPAFLWGWLPGVELRAGARGSPAAEQRRFSPISKPLWVLGHVPLFRPRDVASPTDDW